MNVLSFNNGNNMFIHRIAFPIPDNMIQEAGTHRMLPKNFAQNVDTPYYDASVRIDFDNNASAASIWDGLMENPGPLDEIAETIADILSIDYKSHINIFCAKPDILIVWFKQLMQFTKVVLDEDAEDDEWDEDGAVGEREIIEKNVYRFMAFCDAGYASGFILFNNNDADEVEDEANVTSFLSHIRPKALIDVESVNISFSGNKNSTDFLNKYIKKTICKVLSIRRAHFYTGLPCMCALRGYDPDLKKVRAVCVAPLRTRACALAPLRGYPPYIRPLAERQAVFL